LVREGIDSISLNFDTFASGRINTWRTEIIESKVKDEEKAKSYQLVNRCDDLIEKIRVPRGKARNRVRKQLKDVDPNLKENSDRMDEIFKELQLISKEFVKKLDSGEYEDFETLYNNYNDKIQEFTEEIPIIQKNIREFGIY